jgi:hypothetical protein
LGKADLMLEGPLCFTFQRHRLAVSRSGWVGADHDDVAVSMRVAQVALGIARTLNQ